MKLIYLKSALKCDSLDVSVDIKIPFLEFWLLLSPVAPYIKFVTTNCLILHVCNFDNLDVLKLFWFSSIAVEVAV